MNHARIILFAFIIMMSAASSMSAAGGAPAAAAAANAAANAAQDNDFVRSGFPYNMGGNRSPMLQRAETLQYLFQALARARTQRDNLARELGERADPVIALDNIIRNMTNELINVSQGDSTFGRVMAQGLAGKEYAKFFEDYRISSPVEGAVAGLACAGAQALGVAVRKQAELAADRIFSPLAEGLITRIVDFGAALRSDLFYGGKAPFDVRELQASLTMIAGTFDDLTPLLRDGLRDMLRGGDMTLRSLEPEQETGKMNFWRVLIEDAYISQLELAITVLDRRMPFYSRVDNIHIYAMRLKRMLVHIKELFEQCTSLKQLDSLLDSNKAIVPALKKSIQSSYNRLIELVDPVSVNKPKSASTAGYSGRSSGYSGGYGDRSDNVPLSFDA